MSEDPHRRERKFSGNEILANSSSYDQLNEQAIVTLFKRAFIEPVIN
jgi:hypothetical protein